MRAAKFSELRHARHRAVVIHDFADHARGSQSRDARQVHGRLGLPGAHQHAAVSRAQGKDVAGARQIGRARSGIDGRENGHGAVGSADSGGRAAPRVDRFVEGRAVIGRVYRRHQRQRQLVAALFGQRQADQAAAVLGHEVDGFGRDFFRRHGEVAFVLAVFVVDQHDLPALADFFEGFLDGCKRNWFAGHGCVRNSSAELSESGWLL